MSSPASKTPTLSCGLLFVEILFNVPPPTCGALMEVLIIQWTMLPTASVVTWKLAFVAFAPVMVLTPSEKLNDSDPAAARPPPRRMGIVERAYVISTPYDRVLPLLGRHPLMDLPHERWSAPASWCSQS